MLIITMAPSDNNIVSIFSVMTRRKHPESRTPTKIAALFAEISRVPKGLDLVLSTWGSKFLSTRSFMTQPAERAITVPKEKTRKI